MEEPPGYSTVRKFLSILETKGHVRHRREGPRYLYSPVRPASQAARSMMRRNLHTFFQGSTEQAVATLLQVSRSKLSDEEIRRLTERLKQLRKQRRNK